MPRRGKSPQACATDVVSQRLDKWLWCVRISKTRGEAARLIEAGHVRVNRLKVKKPAHQVRIGDVLTVARLGQVRVCRVLGFSEWRVGAAQAARLREDL